MARCGRSDLVLQAAGVREVVASVASRLPSRESLLRERPRIASLPTSRSASPERRVHDHRNPCSPSRNRRSGCPESVFSFRRNRRSASIGIRVQHGPERARARLGSRQSSPGRRSYRSVRLKLLEPAGLISLAVTAHSNQNGCAPFSHTAGDRLQNVSTTAAESRGLGWTAVNETERRNRL